MQREEIALLVKACRKYRASVPAYLQSAQSELAIIDEIVEKLQEALGSEQPASAE